MLTIYEFDAYIQGWYAYDKRHGMATYLCFRYCRGDWCSLHAVLGDIAQDLQAWPECDRREELLSAAEEIDGVVRDEIIRVAMLNSGWHAISDGEHTIWRR